MELAPLEGTYVGELEGDAACLAGLALLLLLAAALDFVGRERAAWEEVEADDDVNVDKGEVVVWGGGLGGEMRGFGGRGRMHRTSTRPTTPVK